MLLNGEWVSIEQKYYDVANMLRTDLNSWVTPKSSTARTLKRLCSNDEAIKALGLERVKE